jgi:hypothetical protein
MLAILNQETKRISWELISEVKKKRPNIGSGQREGYSPTEKSVFFFTYNRAGEDHPATIAAATASRNNSAMHLEKKPPRWKK